jgi:hypothetical protein
MLLKTMGQAWLLGSLLALAACGDFTLVDPQAAADGPRLQISIGAVTDETTQYDLHAVFSPGTDERGRATEVIDRTLGVEGTPVLPERETPEGFWLYRWQGTQTTTAGLVLLTFPVIAGASPATHSVTVPVTRRTGPADIDLPRGSELILGISLANRVTTGLSGGVEFWQLEIRPSCSDGISRPQLTINGTGPLLSEVRIPWQWLEPLSTDQMSACLQAFSSYEVAGSPYPANASAFVRLAWRIRIVTPG